jgi:glycosyltransferase involved in cell wall biosynthesis
MRLVIAGEGSGRAEIERVLVEGGVAQFAWLPGERRDVPELLRSFDLFCLPSRSEGISNTILEAMASGLPVMATRVGGNGELVEHGATGHLVAADDEAALTATMLSYFRDAAMTRRHGKAGRSRIEQRFSLDAMVRSYDAMYTAQLEQRGGVNARLSRA